MKAESDPIAQDEWLLRRVHKDKFRTAKIPLISPNAFEPRLEGTSRDPDTNGISLYREACLADPAVILSALAPNKQADTGIVRVSVRLLASLGCRPEPDHDQHIPGHVVIPAMDSAMHAADGSALKIVMLHLAEEASRDENIVRWPPALPRPSAPSPLTPPG